MAQNGSLTPTQARAVAALLTERDVSAAALAAHVGRRTLDRWLTLPTFRAALTQAQDDALAGVVRRLTALSDQAADALADALDKDQPMVNRLAAARLLFATLPNLLEVHDLAERIAALENVDDDDDAPYTVDIGGH